VHAKKENHNMKSSRKTATLIVVAVAMLVLGLMIPAAAQDEPTPVQPNYPLNTITVTGTGSALGTPDVANLFIGVEIYDSDLSAAFSESNNRIDNIINAVMEAGVAREDIRTTGLNVFIDRSGPPMPVDSAASSANAAGEPSGQPQNYVVSNQIRLTIRDTDLVADVINAAVEAGANNIFGLEFGIDNRDELESEARTEAMADARARAEELAEIAGVSLGQVVVINEGGGGFAPFAFDAAMSQAGMGGGGAVIEPGQLSVSMQVQVTYAIER
jgi:uncharacterized protein YggE